MPQGTEEERERADDEEDMRALVRMHEGMGATTHGASTVPVLGAVLGHFVLMATWGPSVAVA